MSIVVTGGRGVLGSVVVNLLRERGRAVVPASRRTGFDLETGAGVESVLSDAEVVIHTASHPLRHRRVDFEGTRRVIEVLRRRGGRTPVVYVSIVGCDRIPYPYYRTKHACELTLEHSGLPVTVVRATQFHTLVAALAGVVGRGPIAPAPPMSFQSCEPAWVAARIVDLALADPPEGFRRVPDLAGPSVVSLSDAVRLTRARPPRAIRLPAVGGTLRAFAAGANLAGPEAEIGGSSFTTWAVDR